MRPVPDDQVSAGIHHRAGEADYIAARFAKILFFGKRQPGNVFAFRSAVKRNQHDVEPTRS